MSRVPFSCHRKDLPRPASRREKRRAESAAIAFFCAALMVLIVVICAIRALMGVGP